MRVNLKINLKPKKSWLILDGRAWDDPDRACVYCAYDSTDENIEQVFADRNSDWPDGVIFEYDQEVKIEKGKVVTYIVNQRLIG